MKKILTIIIVLFICSSLCFCATQNKQNTPPPSPQGQMGPGGPGGPGKFGISNEDYNKLNLSKTQKSKIEAIEKKYKPQQGKTNEKPDMAKIQKNENAKNNEFRAILTDSQKKQYDKARNTQKAKQKEMFSKRYKELAKELKFSSAQNEKLNAVLKNSNGNPMEFDKKFESILTASQKKTYNSKKEEFRHGHHQNHDHNQQHEHTPHK